MNCPLHSEQTIDLLLDYSAGKLDKARSTLLESHMKGCANCAAFGTRQSALWRALDQWDPAPVSMGFNRSLWQKIDAAAAAPWYRRFSEAIRLGAWKPAFPLAVATLLIAAGFMLDHPGAEHRPVSRTATMTASGVSITDADQVEKTLDDIQLLREFDAASSGASKTM